MMSDSGSLRVTLQSSPEATPVRGENQIVLNVVQNESGDAVEGLTLSMVPFMPAMGHGSPVVPVFSDEGDGQYRFDDVDLTMAGLWELRTAITGAVSDSVDFSFDVK
ncbi:MAG TPA: FixH family protein [Polyangiaceae bacterium]|nr:FixH family protein [Polyangiaceae bacterium]